MTVHGGYQRAVGVEVHFYGLIFAAALFTTGIVAFISTFIRYGLPVGELERGPVGDVANTAAPMRTVPA